MSQILNDKAFLEQVSSKLMKLKFSDQDKMAARASDLILELRRIKNEGTSISMLKFVKKLFHQFLLNHGFNEQIPSDAFDEKVLQCRYVWHVLKESIFTVTYRFDEFSESVIVTMDRILISYHVMQDIVCCAIKCMPDLTEDTDLEDSFMCEKLFCHLAMKFSKL